MNVGILSQVTSKRIRQWTQAVQREVQVAYYDKFFALNESSTLEQTDREVTVSGDVEETWRCGSEGHGLVGTVMVD